MLGLKLVPELICNNIEVTKKFYTEIFGFDIKYERVNEKFAYFTLNGVDVMASEISGMGRWLVGEMNLPYGRGINLQWDVLDIKTIYNNVLDKCPESIFINMETKHYKCGDGFIIQQQFVVQDPDGYLFRFCCEAGETK